MKRLLFSKSRDRNGHLWLDSNKSPFVFLLRMCRSKFDKVSANMAIEGIYGKSLITSNSDDFLAVYYMCEDCDITILTYLVNALRCFSNILLNNYSKIHTDKLGSKKLSKMN